MGTEIFGDRSLLCRVIVDDRNLHHHHRNLHHHGNLDLFHHNDHYDDHLFHGK